MLEAVPVPILKLVYPIKEPNRTRTRELKVLCLGLGRTGTDSLRTALAELGYCEIHHGYRYVSPSNPGEQPQWLRLALAKYKYHDPTFLNRREFDKVLGDCEAVTDMPSAVFGPELLKAYPEAKVVLNRRRDPEAWVESQKKTLYAMSTTWQSFIRPYFQPELFWITLTTPWFLQPKCDWNFEKNGLNMYEDHYAELEAVCREQGRQWLDWTVEDGWEPLCEFLQKDVPDGKPFPTGNEKRAFHEGRKNIHGERNRQADRNMTFAGILLMAGTLAWLMRVGI